MRQQVLTFQEEEFRALSQVLVPIAVAEVTEDASFRFLSLNTAHTDASGLEEENVIGRGPQDLLSEMEANMVLRRYRKSVETGQAQSYEELLSLPKGQFWWRTSISPIKDADGAVCRLCVSSIPVDQEVRLRNLAQNLVQDIIDISSKQPVVDRCFADSTMSLESMRIVAGRIADLKKDFSPGELELIHYIGKLAAEAEESLCEVKRLGTEAMIKTLSQSLLDAGPLSDLLNEASDEEH
ncbi:MAG: PAS domain-containing protein [Pseudomonadota bacterium]